MSNKKPIGVSAADLQISYSTYVGYPAMWGDSYHALHQVVGYAENYGVPLWLGGDVLEKPYPDSYSMRVLLEELQRCQYGTAFIQGNHELVRRSPWLSVDGFADHAHEKVCTLRGTDTVLYGIDYQPAGAIAGAMARIPAEPPSIILLVHQAWTELMGSRGDATLADLVPDNVRLVISGDFHGHRHMAMTNKNGKTFVLLSPGSTNLRSIAEDPKKYCYLIYDDLSFESLPIKNRPVVYSRVETDNQLDTAIAAGLAAIADAAFHDEVRNLPENLRMPMWIVQARFDLDVSRISKQAAGRAHVFVNPFGDSDAEPAEAPAATTGSLDEVIKTTLEAGPVRDDVLRLWNSADIKGDIEALVKERLTQYMNGGLG